MIDLTKLFLSPKQVHEQTEIAEATTRRLCEQGKLPGARNVASEGSTKARWEVPASDLELLVQLATKPSSPADRLAELDELIERLSGMPSSEQVSRFIEGLQRGRQIITGEVPLNQGVVPCDPTGYVAGSVPSGIDEAAVPADPYPTTPEQVVADAASRGIDVPDIEDVLTEAPAADPIPLEAQTPAQRMAGHPVPPVVSVERALPPLEDPVALS